MNIKTRPLTLCEYQKLVLASPPTWAHIFQLGFITAMRLSDLINLKWSDISNSINIVEGKTQKQRKIIIGHQLHSSLDYFRDPGIRFQYRKFYGQGRENYVLPFKDPSGYRKALVRCCAFAQIDLGRIAFHSLRKTAATQISQNLGVIAASNYLNHTKLSTTMLYIEEDAIEVSSLLESSAMLTRRVKP